MSGMSLNEIMNEMASGSLKGAMGVLNIPKPAGSQAPVAPLSELDAFIQMDSLLASLHKDYASAKAQRIELTALYGGEDAMVEVAMDMEDSAWCAMQTRYLELRGQGDLMERAQRLMRQALERIENDKALEKEREAAYKAKQFAHFLKVSQKIKEMNRVPQIFQWAILLLIFKIPPFDDKPNFLAQQDMMLRKMA